MCSGISLLICNLLMTWCWIYFHVLTCNLYTFFSEVSVKILCSLLVGLFGFLLLIFKSSLFWIIVLYEMYPLQIFSTSLWLSFRSLEKRVFLKSTFFPLFALWMTKAESSSSYLESNCLIRNGINYVCLTILGSNSGSLKCTMIYECSSASSSFS